MKLKLCLMGMLCLFFQARAQQNSPVKYLKVGDKMPDLEISGIMNWKYKNAKLSDLKGKVIILDFWNSFCASCIAGFPKLDSLQRQFKGKMQVFLVNPSNNNETVRSMKIVIDRMNSWSDQPFTLPIVYRDSVISKNFDFYGVPYVVVIGSDGNILSIPEKSELTSANIAKILNGEKVALKQSVQRITPSVKRKVWL